MIRPITEDDVEPLVALADATGVFRSYEIDVLRGEVFYDYFNDRADPGERGSTLDVGGDLQGFVYFAPAPMTEDAWELWWIVVRKDLQGKGTGRRLLQYVEKQVREEGGRVLFIDTSSLDEYEPTRQFYVRNGYEQEAVLRDWFEEGDHRIIFRKVVA